MDVPYVSRLANEIPFAHTLSITRFLGGYTQAAVQQLCSSTAGIATYASYCTPTYEPWSLDYVVNDGSSISYQTALMLDRISPYINAGYSPSDMTLVLINVPWAMGSSAAPQNGSACVVQSTGGSLGVWGQCNPPASYTQWSSTITQFATDLQGAYQAGASGFNFEIGDEYDQTSTFNGQASDFYSLYENAYKSVKSILPGASVAAGDFTEPCYDSTSTGAAGCVYDSKDLLSREIANGDSPSYVTRSLNSFRDTDPHPYPSAAVSDAAASFAYVTAAGTTQPPVEIHQLDFAYALGRSGGYVGVIRSGELGISNLDGPQENVPNISRVFNWGGFATISDGTSLNFLEGAGYIRMIKDNHQGAEYSCCRFRPAHCPWGIRSWP